MSKPAEITARLVNRPETWKWNNARELYAGVDIGTFKIGLVVVDENGTPRAATMRRAEAVKSGMIVDYIGALDAVRELMDEIRASAPMPIQKGATSYPPQTESGNINTTRYILEAVGLEVLAVPDEPSAANRVLNLTDGAIVDIGGGTTGVAVLDDGRIVHTDDEATGGVHLTLVLAGGFKIGYEEAEQIKTDPERTREILPMVRPVVDKISSIVENVLKPFPDVDRVCLVGGTARLRGLAEILGGNIGKDAFQPAYPQVITPLGIALSCLNGNGNGAAKD